MAISTSTKSSPPTSDGSAKDGSTDTATQVTGDSDQFTWGRRFGRIETGHKYSLIVLPAFLFVIISASVALYVDMINDIDDMASITHDHDPSPQLKGEIDKLTFRLDRIISTINDTSKTFVLNSPSPITPSSEVQIESSTEQQEN